jgi:hypothetical protein
VGKLKKYIPEFYLSKYRDQFQVGLSFTFHTHSSDEDANVDLWHFHIWIDLGVYCIEITIGERE